MNDDDTRRAVRAYYESWKDGASAFDEARLRSTMAPDLTFEGPIAGVTRGVEAFIPGLVQFARGLERFRPLQLLVAGEEAASLYECDLSAPAGTYRFAEFFRVRGGRIQLLRLVFDATEFKKRLPPR